MTLAELLSALNNPARPLTEEDVTDALSMQLRQDAKGVFAKNIESIVNNLSNLLRAEAVKFLKYRELGSKFDRSYIEAILEAVIAESINPSKIAAEAIAVTPTAAAGVGIVGELEEARERLAEALQLASRRGTTIKALEQRVSELEEELEKTKINESDAHDYIEILNNKLSTLEENLEPEKLQHADAIRAAEETIAGLKTSLEKTEGNIAELTENLQQAIAEKERAFVELAGVEAVLNNTNANSKAITANYESIIETLNRAIQVTEADANSVREQLSDLMAEQAKLRVSIEEKDQENQNLRESLGITTEHYTALETYSTELVQSFKQWQAEFKAFVSGYKSQLQEDNLKLQSAEKALASEREERKQIGNSPMLKSISVIFDGLRDFLKKASSAAESTAVAVNNGFTDQDIIRLGVEEKQLRKLEALVRAAPFVGLLDYATLYSNINKAFQLFDALGERISLEGLSKEQYLGKPNLAILSNNLALFCLVNQIDQTAMFDEKAVCLVALTGNLEMLQQAIAYLGREASGWQILAFSFALASGNLAYIKQVQTLLFPTGLTNEIVIQDVSYDPIIKGAVLSNNNEVIAYVKESWPGVVLGTEEELATEKAFTAFEVAAIEDASNVVPSSTLSVGAETAQDRSLINSFFARPDVRNLLTAAAPVAAGAGAGTEESAVASPKDEASIQALGVASEQIERLKKYKPEGINFTALHQAISLLVESGMKASELTYQNLAILSGDVSLLEAIIKKDKFQLKAPHLINAVASRSNEMIEHVLKASGAGRKEKVLAFNVAISTKDLNYIKKIKETLSLLGQYFTFNSTAEAAILSGSEEIITYIQTISPDSPKYSFLEKVLQPANPQHIEAFFKWNFTENFIRSGHRFAADWTYSNVKQILASKNPALIAFIVEFVKWVDKQQPFTQIETMKMQQLVNDDPNDTEEKESLRSCLAAIAANAAMTASAAALVEGPGMFSMPAPVEESAGKATAPAPSAANS